MNAQRMNITLPRQVALRLRKKPNKSAFIADAVREKLDEEDQARGVEELARAYRQAALEEAKDMKDWDAMAGDGL